MKRNATEAFLQHLSFVLEELPSLPERTTASQKFKPGYLCPSGNVLEVLGCDYSSATCVCLCRICKLKDWKLDKSMLLAVSAEDYNKWIWAKSTEATIALAELK